MKAVAMRGLQRMILGRLVVGAPPRRRPPALGRRRGAPPPLPAPSVTAPPLPLLWIGIGSSGAWCRRFSRAAATGVEDAETTTARATKASRYDKRCMPIISSSSHRDGAIYQYTGRWEDCGIDIHDRRETLLEPMRLSATTECRNDPDYCTYHHEYNMLQIFSLKLAEAPTNGGTIELYGYTAARDEVDSMLNYVFRRSRDDPIVVQQGSVIKMTGPKRGIALADSVLIEFDMRIKNGEQEDDDPELIDGAVSFYGLHMLGVPFEGRIQGNCGAIDMSLTLVEDAVEATVEVVIFEVQSGFDLSLVPSFSGMEVPDGFHLFDGTIGESCGLNRFVIAVKMNTLMHLKFKAGRGSNSDNVEHHCSFKAKLHGFTNHQIKLEFATISVKVTWATMFVD